MSELQIASNEIKRLIEELNHSRECYDKFVHDAGTTEIFQFNQIMELTEIVNN